MRNDSVSKCNRNDRENRKIYQIGVTMVSVNVYYEQGHIHIDTHCVFSSLHAVQEQAYFQHTIRENETNITWRVFT